MQIQFCEENVGFLTMKWFERSAQGFSPGECPIANRPERATDSCAVYSTMILIGEVAKCSEQNRSVALSGLHLLWRYPGLKPWAVFLEPFHGWRIAPK